MHTTPSSSPLLESASFCIVHLSWSASSCIAHREAMFPASTSSPSVPAASAAGGVAPKVKMGDEPNMPWQSAPPLAIITLAMGGVGGLMSLTNYLTLGRTDRLIGLDEFDYMMLERDIRIRNPPSAAVDKLLASAATRSALERAKADMAAAASKQ